MKKSINRNCEPQTGNFTDSAARLHHQVCRVVSVYSFTCHITVKHGPSPAGREKVKARSLHPTSLLTSLKELRSLQTLHFVFAKLFILVNRWNDNITRKATPTLSVNFLPPRKADYESITAMSAFLMARYVKSKIRVTFWHQPLQTSTVYNITWAFCGFVLHLTCFYFSAILSQAWAINILKTLKEKLGLFWRAQLNDVALYTSPSFSCDWFLVKVTTETHCWSFCEQKTQFSALPSCRHMVWAVCPQQRYLMTLSSWGIFWPSDHGNGVKRLVITNGLNPINLWHQTDACRWKAVTWNVLVSKAFLPPVPRLILMMTVYYMMPKSESVSNILSIVSDVNWVCIYYPLCIRSFIYDTFILTDNKPIRPVSTPRPCIDQLWAVYRILLDVKWRGNDPIWQPLPVDTWWQHALTQCTAKNWSKHRAQDLLVVMGIYRSHVISFEWSDYKTWVTIRANHDTETTCLLPLYF